MLTEHTLEAIRSGRALAVARALDNLAVAEDHVPIIRGSLVIVRTLFGRGYYLTAARYLADLGRHFTGSPEPDEDEAIAGRHIAEAERLAREAAAL